MAAREGVVATAGCERNGHRDQHSNGDRHGDEHSHGNVDINEHCWADEHLDGHEHGRTDQYGAAHQHCWAFAHGNRHVIGSPRTADRSRDGYNRSDRHVDAGPR